MPRSKWAQFGVTYPDGRAPPNDDLPASLLLPMGRMGPRFSGLSQFRAYTEWNNSLIYSTTAAISPPASHPRQRISPGRRQLPPLSVFAIARRLLC